MGYLNKVMLIGNLGQDPIMKTAPSGTPICRLSLATSERTNSGGEVKKKTEWHTIVAFGHLAEVSRDYLRKGRSVYVEGSLHTRVVERDGSPAKKSVEVWARDIRFLSSGGSHTAKSSGESDSDP